MGINGESVGFQREGERAPEVHVGRNDENKVGSGQLGCSLETRPKIGTRSPETLPRWQSFALRQIKFGASAVPETSRKSHSHQLGQASSLHFGHDVGAVDLDGAWTDVEIICDGLVWQAFYDGGQHLPLALRQLFHSQLDRGRVILR